MALSAIDRSSALVVVDLQKGVLGLPTRPHDPASVVARTTQLADAFRAAGRPVVLVRVTRRADGSDAAHGRTEVSAPLGTPPPGWDDVAEPLAGHPEDIVVTKRNWGAFHGTDLDLQLRRRGVTQVVLTGIATSMGVESTARAAHEHGYHVTVVTDAVADRDAAIHRHSVEQIFPRLGETGTTAEVLALLRLCHA